MSVLDPADLHDRLTRGGTLTAEEQRCLDEWYEEQDRQEMAELLASADSNLIQPQALDQTRAKITDSLRAIERLEQKNRQLREEIRILQQEVETRSSRRLSA